jgi:hypothetical protein
MVSMVFVFYVLEWKVHYKKKEKNGKRHKNDWGKKIIIRKCTQNQGWAYVDACMHA